jgi:hypothetical protein
MTVDRRRAAGNGQRATVHGLRAAGSGFLGLMLLAIAMPASAAPMSNEEFVIVGEVLKPEITVVISRENLNKVYDLKLDEDLLDKIVESVREPPF